MVEAGAESGGPEERLDNDGSNSLVWLVAEAEARVASPRLRFSAAATLTQRRPELPVRRDCGRRGRRLGSGVWGPGDSERGREGG